MNLDLISAAMQDRGLSPEQLANACAVSRPTIERILNGSTVNPGILTMSDIAVHLGLSLDDIMDMPHAPHSGPSRSAELSNLYRSVIYAKDLWIKRLSIACAVLVAWYMVCWLIDFSNPTVGWVNLNRSSSVARSRALLIVISAALVAALIYIFVTRKKKSGKT